MAPQMLAAVTDKKPFVLGTRYGPGVEMDKDVSLPYMKLIGSGPYIVVSFLQERECLHVH